jgi:hypothetical protein
MPSGYNLRPRLPNPSTSTPPEPVAIRAKVRKQELAPRPSTSRKRTEAPVTKNEQPRKRTRLSYDAQPKVQKEQIGTHYRSRAHRHTEKLRSIAKNIHEAIAGMKILVAESTKPPQTFCQAADGQERSKARKSDDDYQTHLYGSITTLLCLLVYLYVAAVTVLLVDIVKDGARQGLMTKTLRRKDSKAHHSHPIQKIARIVLLDFEMRHSKHCPRNTTNLPRFAIRAQGPNIIVDG